MAEVVDRIVALARERGLGMSVPTVAVVGFPNVGKSTLVNRLAGGREAVTHREAGVTRDRKRVPCEWNGVAFDLLDTGGIDIADESELAEDIRRQARLGIAEADVVLLVVDGTRRDPRRRRRGRQGAARAATARPWSSSTRSTARATST